MLRPCSHALLQRATAALVCGALLLAVFGAGGRETAQPAVSLSALPVEARTTLERIRTGEAFPYERDGVVFGNREGLLPSKPRGYYHEYTVPTPGVRGRGARRIVCGGHAAMLAECYYSDDHYQSFRRIEQ